MNTDTLPNSITETFHLSRVIEYRTKNVYGRENMYIVSDHAKFVKIISGKQTIDYNDMKALEDLGFTFTRVF